MNIIDIIVIALLIFALWRGWSSGILVQLSGILGIVVGSWLAYRFSEQLCKWFEIDLGYKWLMFLAVLIIVFVIIAIISRLLTKMLSYGGFSIPIKLLGAVVSAVKITILLALIMRTFVNINHKTELTDSHYLQESVSYAPLDKVASLIFPYLTTIWTDVDNQFKLTPQVEERIEEEVERQIEQRIEEKLETKQNKNRDE